MARLVRIWRPPDRQLQSSLSARLQDPGILLTLTGAQRILKLRLTRVQP